MNPTIRKIKRARAFSRTEESIKLRRLNPKNLYSSILENQASKKNKKKGCKHPWLFRFRSIPLKCAQKLTCVAEHCAPVKDPGYKFKQIDALYQIIDPGTNRHFPKQFIESLLRENDPQKEDFVLYLMEKKWSVKEIIQIIRDPSQVFMGKYFPEFKKKGSILIVSKKPRRTYVG
jgi:hypothetical protein